MNLCLSLLLLVTTLFMAAVAAGQSLPGTQPLTAQGDIAAQMVAGIDRALMRDLEASISRRTSYWNRDFTSPEAYLRSIEPNRQRFRKIIGLADRRESPAMQFVTPVTRAGSGTGRVGKGAGYKIYAVRWSVFKGVEAEGLLLLPDRRSLADIVALPDCDTPPEMLAGLTPGIPQKAQFARRLAENGCRVLIPTLIDRRDTYSGIPGIRMTNQPHREFLYRAAYEMGRHIIGYEAQKVLAAVDWFADPSQQTAGREAPQTSHRPIGVIGYGEGGLIALYAAAADTRIKSAMVCGYFQAREGLWREPIYRNVFGLLREFGDAEIAALVAPRFLVIQACHGPEISSPPPAVNGRNGAASGALVSPPLALAEAEVERARKLTAPIQNLSHWLTFIAAEAEPPGNEEALTAFVSGLGLRRALIPSAPPLLSVGPLPDSEARLKRQFDQIAAHTQQLMQESPRRREEFWAKADSSTPEKWLSGSAPYRDYFWEEILGKLPASALPLHPRSRLVYDTPKFRGYEVMLDVASDVFAYGILLVPKEIKAGERRPVVVCQHGLEGRPQDVADPAVDSPYYHQFACRLAEQGYVTFAPQNPYIGNDSFRVLLRKAQPLKLTLFSFIVRQQERLLDWLETLPFVDPERMAFYGLSYGGKTAMRVPAVLERYCLSICSGDYNEWIWKNSSMQSPYSYLLTNEYDMPEFDLANTFNYAEMSGLICPRPFMVERGHNDGVAPDEWVAYEYAKTRRRYDLLGLGDKTEIEFFNGPHTIHGVGTFAFLKKHLPPLEKERP